MKVNIVGYLHNLMFPIIDRSKKISLIPAFRGEEETIEEDIEI
jgi:hypothetical protein